ncbi:unnamed protein product [Aureobasidium uvarum]|uniref:Derlin n=1 Tax=Aureobasidium uvarum TaxID=2773716 RepID=A0A9N8KML6_9PEZI|nr:unnamed protein product [Aureobasidium uvarum]
MSSPLADAFWAAPPIARTLTAATVVLSLNFWLLQVVNPYYSVFIPRLVFKLWTPQVWRLVTAFLITSEKLGIIMDPYFLFTYCKALEVDSPRFAQPGDFFVALVFNCSVILLLVSIVFGGGLVLAPLSLALAYLHVQDAPDAMMSFFFINMRRRYLPICMLAVTLVMVGPFGALQQAFGLVSAHLYDFLTRIWPSYGGGYNPIRTPQMVQRWFAKTSGPGNNRSYGTAFQARPSGSVGAQPQAGSSRSGGWTSGFTSGTWGSRGAGRRLGGD